jgi:hypothetical protein
MAKPMATGKELKRLRDKGMEVNAENLRKVKEELKKEAMAKADKANRKGMKAGPAVSEPAGYAKGGMVKANCGASTKAAQKGTYACGGMVKKK